MKILNKIKPMTFLSILSFFTLNLNANIENNDTISFTIQQALDYSISNNIAYKNSIADMAIANEQVKEVRAIGIPQIKGSIQFQDALQRQVFIFPVNGTPMPIRIGNKFTTQAGISLNWLMLDGSYLVGLQAAKQFTEMAKRINIKNAGDLKVEVAKTYFSCLIAQEAAKLIFENKKTLETIYTQTSALNKEGFVEELEVDRLKLQLSNLDIAYEKALNQYDILIVLLKTKLGISPEKPIKLTDNIEDVNEKFITDEKANQNIENRADYRILNQQLALSKLNVKRYEFERLPSLFGTFQYNQSNFGEKIDYSSKNWYDNYFYAFQLSVPIFNGFGTQARIQKAKIEVNKVENTLQNTANLMKLDYTQSVLKLQNAMKSVTQQKENLNLAQKIYKISSIKYQEGVGSNLELTTANQDVKNSQTNYLSALYELIIAKIDFYQSIGIEPKF